MFEKFHRDYVYSPKRGLNSVKSDLLNYKSFLRKWVELLSFIRNRMVSSHGEKPWWSFSSIILAWPLIFGWTINQVPSTSASLWFIFCVKLLRAFSFYILPLLEPKLEWISTHWSDLVFSISIGFFLYYAYGKYIKCNIILLYHTDDHAVIF